MTFRGLGLALMISLGVHVIVMSLVGITSYEGPGRTKPYTRIDFLGPILGKTAFDMMIEHTTRIRALPHGAEGAAFGEKILSVTAKDKIPPDAGAGLREEEVLDASVAASLSGWKAMPDVRTMGGYQAPRGRRTNGAVNAGVMPRKVIFRPDSPSFMKGQYGDKDSFRIKVKAMVDPAGSVVKTEPLTTTGYPQLDMAAAKFVKGWMYEPAKGSSPNEEWMEEEIVLKAVE